MDRDAVCLTLKHFYVGGLDLGLQLEVAFERAFIWNITLLSHLENESFSWLDVILSAPKAVFKATVSDNCDSALFLLLVPRAGGRGIPHHTQCGRSSLHECCMLGLNTTPLQASAVYRTSLCSSCWPRTFAGRELVRQTKLSLKSQISSCLCLLSLLYLFMCLCKSENKFQELSFLLLPFGSWGSRSLYQAWWHTLGIPAFL